MKSSMPKTDCRDCLFYNGESCKLPFFSNHKANLSDYCIDFEPKRRKDISGQRWLKRKTVCFNTRRNQAAYRRGYPIKTEKKESEIQEAKATTIA